MKKRLSITLIAVLLLSMVPLFGGVRGAISVGGLISSDTVWSQGNAYKLSGPVGIASGVTLTIEPGVYVNLASYYIQVNGTLNAQGTSASNIFFNGSTINYQSPSTSGFQNTIQFGDSSTDWNDQTVSGSIIQNALFQSAGIGITNCSPKISRNTFNQSGITVSSGSPLITNNYFYLAGVNGGGSPTISNNYFQGNGYQNGISVGDHAYLSDNVIDRFWQGAVLNGPVTFTGNTITNCYNIAVSSSSDDAVISKNFIQYNTRSAGISGRGTIESNTIINNKVGIETSSANIRDNNIYSNTDNNLALTGSSNLDVSNNYWGTTNNDAIKQSIRDSSDDFTLGTATYTPFLSSPSTSAPTQPLAAVTAPTPAPTSWNGQTSSPTQIPQSSPPSDWLSSIGSTASGPNNQLQAYIVELAQLVLVGLAVAWVATIGVYVGRRYRQRRSRTK